MKIMLMISGLFMAATTAHAAQIQSIECKVNNGTITIAQETAPAKATWYETAGTTTTAPSNVVCESFKQGTYPSDESAMNLLKMMGIDSNKVAGTVYVNCVYGGQISNQLMQINDKNGKRLGAVMFTANGIVMPIICQ